MTQPNQDLRFLVVNADGTKNSLYPLGDKFPVVETMTLTGIELGTLPTTIFHCRVAGGDLAPVVANSPEIGDWATLSSGSLVTRTSVVNGRPWICLRDPTRVAESTENRTYATFTFSGTQKFYFSYRLADDPTKIMVGANSVGAEVTQTASIFKPAWFGEDNNTPEIPDIVIGTWSGGGAFVSGNTNQPLKAVGGGQYYYPAIDGRPFKIGSSLLRGYYQSGQESSAGAKDAWVELSQSSHGGTSIAGALGDPYSVNSAGTGMVDFNYYELMLGKYFGNLTNGTNANIQALYADIYMSSSRTRVIAANNAVLASATESYDIPLLTLNNTTKVITYAPHTREAAMPYRHVIIDTNPLVAATIIQNVSYV